MSDVPPPASPPFDPDSRPALVVSRRAAKRIGMVSAAVVVVAGVALAAFFLGKANTTTHAALARSRVRPTHHARRSHHAAPAPTLTTTMPSTTTTTTTTTPPPSTTTTTTTVPVLPVLPPATVPPVVGECSQQLIFDADGNAGPLTCTNGDINVLAWQYYAKMNSSAMSLGPDATPSQVYRALCAGVYNTSFPIQDNIYALSATYYGWHFAVNPSDEINNGSC